MKGLFLIFATFLAATVEGVEMSAIPVEKPADVSGWEWVKGMRSTAPPL
jgi:hypothetical protein